MEQTNEDSNSNAINTGPANEKWLEAHYDPLACLYTFTQCMALADISSTGENRLVIADLGTGSYDMKLKVYKGTALVSEHTIIDLPTAVVTFYMDLNEPRTPAVAVASGPHMYIYKNLRPYFKFTLPTLEVNEAEQQLWKNIKEDSTNTSSLFEKLNELRNDGVTLTVRSLKLLQLPVHERDGFIDTHKQSPLKRQTVITCMDTLNKSMTEEDAMSCLVLGTEDSSVYVLDPEAFTVLTTMSVAAVPVFLTATGLYDVEFRVIVACRNGSIYTLRRGTKTGKLCCELNSQPVGLQRTGKNIVVGCMDETLHWYTTKGKKLWSVKLPSSITTMQLLDHPQLGFKAVMVALSNSQVHIYRDKVLVDVINTPDAVTGIKFGKFGREDSTLIMTTSGGGLIVKIVKRTATFEKKDIASGPPASQNMKLNVPKKTKLFVDQMMRERESSVAMHRQFQHDLYQLRLETARSYVKTLESSMSPISTNPAEPLKLSAQIQGIGPTFKMTILLQNTSLSVLTMNLFIAFEYDEKLYTVHKQIINVPLLVPGLSYAFETFIDCLSEKGISDYIKVFVVKKGTSSPLLTAMINMPVSETMLIV